MGSLSEPRPDRRCVSYIMPQISGRGRLRARARRLDAGPGRIRRHRQDDPAEPQFPRQPWAAGVQPRAPPPAIRCPPGAGLPLRLMPGMQVEDARPQMPLKRPADMERYLEGLRQAGLAD